MSDVTFAATSIDCANASASAAFYAELLGWKVTYDEVGMAAVEGDGTTLYFGEIAGYVAPGWPSDSKQFHLDLRAPDPEALVDRVSQLGCSKTEFQPGESCRSEEHTSELQSLMRNSYAVLCLNKKNHQR